MNKIYLFAANDVANVAHWETVLASVLIAWVVVFELALVAEGVTARDAVTVFGEDTTTA